MPVAKSSEANVKVKVMERFGRRMPLIIGGVWQSAWLFVFAAAGTAKDPATSKSIGDLMIVSACLFIFGYASTWAPGVWIISKLRRSLRPNCVLQQLTMYSR